MWHKIVSTEHKEMEIWGCVGNAGEHRWLIYLQGIWWGLWILHSYCLSFPIYPQRKKMEYPWTGAAKGARPPCVHCILSPSSQERYWSTHCAAVCKVISHPFSGNYQHIPCEEELALVIEEKTGSDISHLICSIQQPLAKNLWVMPKTHYN